MNTRRNLLAGIGAIGAAALGWSMWQRLGEEPELARGDAARAGYFPNTPLYTHEGKQVRFYDDLIRGKVVAINMMYADCGDICPAMTANLWRVQQLLGERAGRDVFMYSITLQPERDTPQRLKEYAEMYRVKPGWLFLTGAPADIERLRYRLGFYDIDRLVDVNKTAHTGIVRIGNDAYERWSMAPSLAEPEQILATINHVDRAVVHTAYQRGGEVQHG